MYFDPLQNILANIDGLVSTDTDNNPYMDGQKLPVAAKKGHFWNFEKDNDSYRKFLLLLNFHFETFQLPSSANILEKRAVSTIIKMFEPSYDFENMLTKHLSSVTKLSNIQTENTYNNIWSAKLCNSNTDHQKIKSQLVHYLFL